MEKRDKWERRRTGSNLIKKRGTCKREKERKGNQGRREECGREDGNWRRDIERRYT